MRYKTAYDIPYMKAVILNDIKDYFVNLFQIITIETRDLKDLEFRLNSVDNISVADLEFIYSMNKKYLNHLYSSRRYFNETEKVEEFFNNKYKNIIKAIPDNKFYIYDLNDHLEILGRLAISSYEHNMFSDINEETGHPLFIYKKNLNKLVYERFIEECLVENESTIRNLILNSKNMFIDVNVTEIWRNDYYNPIKLEIYKSNDYIDKLNKNTMNKFLCPHYSNSPFSVAKVIGRITIDNIFGYKIELLDMSDNKRGILDISNKKIDFEKYPDYYPAVEFILEEAYKLKYNTGFNYSKFTDSFLDSLQSKSIPNFS